ncbi:MAG TPA: rod shape-determining protein MreC [Phycisphaerae bacterium]|nr:rod shape-determining protein MreC [Phycisphaerae bacterium]HOJ73144.1 rod shape-determining protein MreC [Phycisphaerae bacterium]HOM52203.1 rod shape-determining protein MreC [Phycisphaerae bacterium]HON65698.1 rod shape-determining protein MreC [Phycisphaerae bacterium]HOQ88378.1 rod shape-determining protein MreC [Phycisphaerae bacterium]
MYYRRLRKPSKPTIFALLMLGSATMALLPRDFFASARNMTQLVAFSGYPVSRAADRISDSAKALAAEPVPAHTHAEVVKARQAAENQNIVLSGQLLELQNLVQQLTRFRNERRNFPAEGRLIPARVVGWDAVPGRDSMVLLKSRSNVDKGDWVTSRIAVQAGSQDGITNDLRVLARETLIGWVEQTAPYVSRVALLSDRYSKVAWRVNVAAINRGKPRAEFVLDGDTPADFALEGIGDGQMRILDINARFIEQELIRVGDVVTTDGHDPKLPLRMVIGDIVEIHQVKKQPLLYYAIVKHRCDPKDLTNVFIVDVSQ